MPKGERGSRGLQEHNAATRNLYDKSKNRGLWEFRGVDGEGGTVDEEGTLFGSRHQYLSLRCGPYLLDTGKPLSWKECFAFLADLQKKSIIYVSYFFDYDITMMIRTLPRKTAAQLLNRHLRGSEEESGNKFTRPVTYEGFEFDYLPHKEFKVRRITQAHWTIISDVGQFFQSSFLATLIKWGIGTDEELEMIRKGKSMRASFAETDDEIRAYNALECVLLEQLMTDFRQVCKETGYVPKKWQGPGHLASAMLEAHGVPRRESIPILANKDFYNLALAGYYGGRFETTAAGPVRTPIYQYDINSAYPAILKTLPCLIHGSWKQSKTRPVSGLWFGNIYFNHDAPRYLYNLPFRLKNGNIQFPKEGNGVYWSTEIEAAERAGTNIEYKSGWVYEPHCNCQWFSFIDSYYQQRLALGKTTKGYVLKLAGNSIYGKIAQSIGYAPYANPVWAGLITAGCRAMLIDAYSQAEGQCFMLATDGLFMSCKLDLPISNKLGEWDETVHPDGMFIVQPGIYFISDEIKTRGVEHGRIQGMRDVFEQQFSKFYESHGIDHTVSVPVTNFITARQAIVRNKWQLAGVWEETTREISFDWSSKRKRGIALTENNHVRTLPHDGRATDHSMPYQRMIGGGLRIASQDRWESAGLAEAERASEQPDWIEPLL